MEFPRTAKRDSVSVWRLIDRPGSIRSPRMVDEKDPLAVRQAAHHLHAVVMDFDRLAIFIATRDPPLRPAQRKSPDTVV
ncbi:MAG: hypothetical protein HC936_04010 [Leptolyngbyaceae cyanobacterium SU_3_3]|nr:hypothetical protein [Leptolyngbyaceae cyanobacterium SU_3_3]